MKMRKLTIYRAKIIFLGLTLALIGGLLSFSHLSRAQIQARSETKGAETLPKEIAAYRTWQRVNTAPQFVIEGAYS